MSEKRTVTDCRYFVWRYTIEDEPSDQLQQGIQAYIQKHKVNPFLVLIPQGLNLLPPMSGFVVEQNEYVPPCRFYFAVKVEEQPPSKPIA